MQRRLTGNQWYVLATLRKRGMAFLADETEECWRRGERYYLDLRVNAAGLRRAFEQGNREAVDPGRGKRARGKTRRRK